MPIYTSNRVPGAAAARRGADPSTGQDTGQHAGERGAETGDAER
ncbi:hypothetical protein [Pseudonocardia dioxanivorans]|jgi:hypothetical protein|nr:hypothetical protein [Pseudonocardia dioxanivorans]